MVEKILHLTLMKRWFDEILVGTKKVEYREIKPYWTKRLFEENGKPKHYDFVLFRNGYSKSARKIITEFKGLRVKDKYEILLGEIVNAA